jgi:AcrR family transcriptional regulator
MTAMPVDRRKIRAAERRAETRERLLAAAIAVFTEQGFGASTTKAITERAGVAAGVLFHYFPTKSDLLLAVLARHPLSGAMRQRLQEQGTLPVAESLPGMAREWLALLHAHYPLGLTLFQQAHGDERVQAAIVQAAREIVELLADYFAAHIATGELRPFAPEAVAQMVIQALGHLSTPCAGWSDRDCEQMLDAQLEILLHGILPDDSRDAHGSRG